MIKSESFTSLHHSQPYHISSEEALLNAFRLKDQKHVMIPKGAEFPLSVRHYLSWADPSGTYTYLLFKRPNWELPRGLVFRRTTTYQNTSNICDWCHSYGGSDQIGMLSVRVNPRLTIGQYLCLDLDCLEKLETQIGTSGKNYDTLAEQVCDKIDRFFERTIMAPPPKKDLDLDEASQDD